MHDLDLTTDPPPQVTVSLVVSLMQPVAKADHGDQPPLMVTTAGAAKDKVSTSFLYILLLEWLIL